MKIKVEIYPASKQEGNGFWVAVCINVGSYYKHMKNSQVYCQGKQEIAEATWNAFNNKVCPECGHVFSSHGWDGIDTHWRAMHEEVISYENAWKLISKDKYVEVMLASAE